MVKKTFKKKQTLNLFLEKSIRAMRKKNSRKQNKKIKKNIAGKIYLEINCFFPRNRQQSNALAGQEKNREKKHSGLMENYFQNER